jgi:hypothetical protein
VPVRRFVLCGLVEGGGVLIRSGFTNTRMEAGITAHVGIETHPTGRRGWNGSLAVSQFRLLLLYTVRPFDGLHALLTVSELMRSSSCRARNDGPQRGSVTVRFNLQLAVEFV